MEVDIAMVDTERHSRQIRLPGLGIDGQRRLASARVVVVGAGGLGSIVLPALAGAGVGTLVVVDDDRVEISNLHRQTIHGSADVGRGKVDSAVDSLSRIDDGLKLVARAERLTAANAFEVLDGADLIVDGSDNFATRYLVTDAAHLLGIPVVWGAVAQYAGQVGISLPGDGPGYRDLFPVPPAPDSVLSCEVGGVLGPACTVIGGQMAAEAIKLITGVGRPLVGVVTTYDALSGRFRELEYRRDPDAPIVTGLIDYDLFCGVASQSTTISPDELAAAIAAGEVDVIDVREPWERSIASMANSIEIPLAELAASDAVPMTDRLLVAVCHHGVRSMSAVRILADRGVAARSLSGGIDAYARLIDPTIARY